MIAEKSHSGSNLMLGISRFGWEHPSSPWISVAKSPFKCKFLPLKRRGSNLEGASLGQESEVYSGTWLYLKCPEVFETSERLADMIKDLRQDLCPSPRAVGGQAGYSRHFKWQLTTMCRQVNQVLSLHSCLSQSLLRVGKYLITINIPLSPMKEQHKHILSTLPWAGGKMAVMLGIKVYGQET